MQKQHRLRENSDFQRLRREGKTLVHPLVVLSCLPNDREQSRFGFAVGSRIAKAAKRNRIKRRMREAVRVRLLKQEIVQGWDVVLIARKPILDESFQQIDRAIGHLLRRAGLVSEAKL